MERIGADGTISKQVDFRKRCPQKGVLSPLIWSIHVCDPTSTLCQTGNKIFFTIEVLFLSSILLRKFVCYIKIFIYKRISYNFTTI